MCCKALFLSSVHSQLPHQEQSKSSRCQTQLHAFLSHVLEKDRKRKMISLFLPSFPKYYIIFTPLNSFPIPHCLVGEFVCLKLPSPWFPIKQHLEQGSYPNALWGGGIPGKQWGGVGAGRTWHKERRQENILHGAAGHSFLRKCMLITRRGHMEPLLLGRSCPRRERGSIFNWQLLPVPCFSWVNDQPTRL